MHLSPVASDSVWWWWWWCIWYAVFNLFLTHMRPMSVCFVCACVFARSFWWSLYICTDQEKQTNLEKNTEEFVDSRSLSHSLATCLPMKRRWQLFTDAINHSERNVCRQRRHHLIHSFRRSFLLSFFRSFSFGSLASRKRKRTRERRVVRTDLAKSLRHWRHRRRVCILDKERLRLSWLHLDILIRFSSMSLDQSSLISINATASITESPFDW